MKSIEKRRRSDGKQFLFNQTFVYVFFIKQYQEISFESDVILLIEFSTVIERSNFRSIVSYPVNIQRNLVKPHKTVKSIEKRSEPFPLGGAAVRLADPRRRLSASASISIDFVAGTRTSTAADKVHRFSLHYDRFPPGLLPVFFYRVFNDFYLSSSSPDRPGPGRCDVFFVRLSFDFFSFSGGGFPSVRALCGQEKNEENGTSETSGEQAVKPATYRDRTVTPNTVGLSMKNTSTAASAFFFSFPTTGRVVSLRSISGRRKQHGRGQVKLGNIFLRRSRHWCKMKEKKTQWAIKIVER